MPVIVKKELQRAETDVSLWPEIPKRHRAKRDGMRKFANEQKSTKG